MRHGVGGKKLSRTKNQRTGLFRNLMRSLVLEDRIVTSHAKAKAIQGTMEKLITRSKKGGDANNRLVLSVLDQKRSVQMLQSYAKSRFSVRQSGFTRIIRMGHRRGDGAEEVMLTFVDPKPQPVVKEAVESTKTKSPAKLKRVAKEKTTVKPKK